MMASSGALKVAFVTTTGFAAMGVCVVGKYNQDPRLEHVPPQPQAHGTSGFGCMCVRGRSAPHWSLVPPLPHPLGHHTLTPTSGFKDACHFSNKQTKQKNPQGAMCTH
jgi:hypothetical protein